MKPSRDRIEGAAADEFDRWAEVGRGNSMERGHAPVVRPIVDRWALDAGSRVLDVGCGSGWAVRYLLDRGAGEGLGVDISPAMIEQARRGPGTFEVASGESLPYPDQHVTHVLSVESIYYYADPVAALREWRRVTRGRLAIVIELYAENTGSAVWADVLDVPVHLWSEARWAEALRAAGWKDVGTERVLQPGPITPQAEFTPSAYTPTWAHHVAYMESGALALTAVSG